MSSKIRGKLQRINEEIQYLREKGQSIDDSAELAHREPGYSVQKSLQIDIESALDIGRELLSINQYSQPDENRAVFETLPEHQIIPCDYVDTYGNMVSFRNILVHEYFDVDVEEVFQVIQNLEDLEQLAQDLGKAIQKHL